MTTQFITLNVWDTEPIRVKINQGEINSRFLKVQFIDKNQPLNLKGKTVFFYAKKPDDNLIFNTCEVTNEKDGTINLAVTSQMSLVGGTMKDCEFHVIDSEFSKLKIKGLILEIEHCTDFNSVIESTSEFSALDKSLKDAQDIINAYSEENIIEKITSMDGAESGIDADLLDGKHGSDYVTIEQFGSAVPQARTINSKPLTSDVELNCEDIGAAAIVHEHNADDITSGTLPIENGGTSASTTTQALKNLGAVPQERTINLKPLSSNIELNCADIGAAEENHVHDFSELINTPTTLAGYGITDDLSSEHIHTFNSITEKPTTLAGYGITDAVAQSRTINSKPLSSNIELSCTDIGAAATIHTHSVSNITSGTLPISRGGTGATTASAAISNLHGVECTTGEKNYYVATNGSDSNTGLTASNSFRTIQHAIDILPKYLLHDVTIYVADGNYNEDVIISGFSGATLTLSEQSASSAVPTNKKTKSITVCNNSAAITISGINCTTTTKTAIRVISNGGYIFLNRVSAVTSSTYDGVHASETPQIAVFNSCFSNKANAIHIANTCLSVATNSGAGNSVGYFLEKSSEMRLVDQMSTLAGTTDVWQTAGSTKYNAAGNIY